MEVRDHTTNLIKLPRTRPCVERKTIPTPLTNGNRDCGVRVARAGPRAEARGRGGGHAAGGDALAANLPWR